MVRRADLWTRARHGADQRRLARVGEADQPNVRDESHREQQLPPLRATGGCYPVRVCPRALEDVAVALATRAAARNEQPVAGIDEFFDQCVRRSVGHPAVWRHLDQNFRRSPAALNRICIGAGLRADRHAAAKVPESIDGAVTHEKHVAACASIPACGLSAPEPHCSLTAGAAAHEEFGAIKEEAIELVIRQGCTQWATAW
eukprot:scaffold1268_cov102-Isochrysis_galbana.AAC.4